MYIYTFGSADITLRVYFSKPLGIITPESSHENELLCTWVGVARALCVCAIVNYTKAQFCCGEREQDFKQTIFKLLLLFSEKRRIAVVVVFHSIFIRQSWQTNKTEKHRGYRFSGKLSSSISRKIDNLE